MFDASAIVSAVAELSIKEICVDEDLKIISAPCYMMNAKVDEVYNNIKMAVDKLSTMIER